MFKQKDQPPAWRFAPTAGGAEHGWNNAAQVHFASDPMTKMVREVLQNSLDHPAPGIDTVEVALRTFQLDPEDVLANTLKSHAQSALNEVTGDQDPQAVQHYQNMVEILSRPSINCLAVTDAGTTGLQDRNWRNLIFLEGAPTNTPGESKGGSFGFGKNAPFNLSDCNTVVYSTRYVSMAKRGRVEHMIGRAQLISHNDPQKPGTRLQQTGFLAIHTTRNNPDKPYNDPVQGPGIPDAFRLNNTGTGIFIIGFSPPQEIWIQETAKAAVTQFFHAIHTGKLKVTIHPETQSDSERKSHQLQNTNQARIIDRETLQDEIERLPPKDPTHHYYAAIVQGGPKLTDPSGLLSSDNTPKRLNLWIHADPQAPRRLAHINRRGMLITEARQFSNNPFYPDGGRGWTGWAGVTAAENDQTDRFLRKMEPPAHDAIKYRQLRDPDEQYSAERELRHQREQITSLIREKIDNSLKQAGENLTELADLFPDDNGENLETRRVRTRTVKHHETNVTRVSANEDEEGSEYDDEPEDENGETGGGGENTSGAPGGQTRGTKTTREEEQPPGVPVQNARIIRTATDELTMSLVMPETDKGYIEFQIKTAGEQYQRNEESVGIDEVDVINTTKEKDQTSKNMLVRAEKVEQAGDVEKTKQVEKAERAEKARNSIRLEAPAGTPVTMKLKLKGNNPPYRSYSVMQPKQTEEIAT